MPIATDPPDQAEANTPSKSNAMWALERDLIWAEVLPVVINYFAPTARYDPVRANLLQRGSADVDDWKAYVRGLLADADDLIPIVQRVLLRPNFQYERQELESVGSPRGRLDVVAYARSRSRREVPRRYPIHEVNRVPSTPENLLAAASVSRMLADIEWVLSSQLLATSGPEYRWASRIESSLRDLITAPTLRELRSKALTMLEIGQDGFLLEQVENRVRAGHAEGGPYQWLCEWAECALVRRSILASGQEPALIYGEGFDDRLFELWVLAKTLQAMSARFGPPSRVNWTMSNAAASGPWAKWESNGWSLWYQPRLDALGCGDTGWHMTGYPDVVLMHEGAGQESQVMLIDAKRRRSSDRPSDLLYKLLGYFENLPGLNHLYGGIVYWNPEGFIEVPGAVHSGSLYEVATTTCSHRSGRMIATGISPADEGGSNRAFELLTQLAVDASRGLAEERPV